jgi:hypothetical protein
MRYADNLAHGHGLVWNIGEKVEGFTNPLTVFVMAGAIKLFGQNYASLAIQIMGLLCLIANIFLVRRVLEKLLAERRNDFLVFLGVILTMAWYPVMYWSVFGMETGYLTTLILSVIYLSLYKDTAGRPNVWISVLLSLVYLARPEGAIFIALFYIIRFFQKLSEKRGWLMVGIEATITALPIIGYQMFRLSYYGLSVPNTYLLKATGMPLLDRVKNGLGFYQPFLNRIQLFILPIILFFFVYLFEAGSSLKEKISNLLRGPLSYITLFVGSFAAYSAYQVWVGGDPWPPFWRMTVPYTVLFFIAFVVTAARLKDSFNMRTDHFMAFMSAIVCSLLVFVPFDYHYDFTRLEPYQSRNNKENINSALVIKELTTDKASVATFWAGTVPYISQRYSLDPLGKMDPHIAKLAPDLSGALSNPRGMYSIPGHNKYDLNYTFKEKSPDVIVYLAFNNHFCSWASQNLEDWCKANYNLVEYKGTKLLLKKGSPFVLYSKITSDQYIDTRASSTSATSTKIKSK